MGARSPNELQGDINRAIQILQLFTDPTKRDVQMLIPTSVLVNAHGLLIIRLYRGGLMVSGKKGTGIIIARLPDGSWSAPSGVSLTSLGYGYQAGVDVIDSVIVMNYRGAVKAFFDGGGQLQLGLNASVSAGPLGRSADVAASASGGNHIAATYAYSISKGLFAGYSFEGSKISERRNTNAAFYGRPIQAREILTGAVSRPASAQRLYDILTSLGAGPRPGLPFAPKKGTMMYPPPQQQQGSTYPQPMSPQNTQYSSPIGSSGPSVVRPLHEASWLPQQQNSGNPSSSSQPPMKNDVEYDEPPPPYSPPSQPNDNIFGDMKQQQPHDRKPSINGGTDVKTSLNNPFVAQSTDVYSSVVVAKYDYVGQQPGDLSFSAGDHIIVTKRNDNRQSWWEGEIGDRKGSFPANYTEDLTD